MPAHSSRPGLKGAFRDLLNRNYRIVPAVNDVSFIRNKGVKWLDISVRRKESTTIKMLAGISTRTSGDIFSKCIEPACKQREEFVRTIGVVFGQRRHSLWWDIAVQEPFRLLRRPVYQTLSIRT